MNQGHHFLLQGTSTGRDITKSVPCKGECFDVSSSFMPLRCLQIWGHPYLVGLSILHLLQVNPPPHLDSWMQDPNATIHLVVIYIPLRGKEGGVLLRFTPNPSLYGLALIGQQSSFLSIHASPIHYSPSLCKTSHLYSLSIIMNDIKNLLTVNNHLPPSLVSAFTALHLRFDIWSNCCWDIADMWSNPPSPKWPPYGFTRTP